MATPTVTNRLLAPAWMPAALLVFATLARAGTFVWDGGGSNNNWSTKNNWNPNATPSAATLSDYTFGGSTRLTPNADGTTAWQVNSITFSSGSGAFTIGGFTLNLGATGVTNNSTALQTISNAIVLQATATFNAASGDLASSGSISGSFGLSKTGTGALTLSGANTFTGGVTLNAGTLKLNNATALGATSGTFTINGGTIDNTSSAAITVSNNNAQAWNGNFTFSGTHDLNLGTGAVTLNASRQVTVSAGNLTVGGSISGSGDSLTKLGSGTLVLNGDIATGTGSVNASAGTLTLAGNNTYTGGTTLSAGATLNLNSATALGGATGLFTVNGGTLDNTSGAAITLSGNGGQNWNGSFGFTGTSDLNLGTAAITLNTTPTVTVAGGNLTVGGVISGANGLTKAGAGTLVLSGANAYTGQTTISQGTLQLNGNALSGTAGTLGNATSAVVLNDNNTSTSATSLLLGTSGTTVGRDISVVNFGTGTTTLGAGFTSGTGTFSGNITLGKNATFDAEGTTALTFNGVILGTGGITKAGSGNVTLSGNSANLYSGTTTVNAGGLVLAKSTGTAIAGNIVIGNGTGTATVQLGADNQIASTAAVTFNSTGGTPTLDLNGHSQTLASINSTNTGAVIALGSPASATSLTVGDSSSTTFSGSITGGASATVVKQGSGTLTLNGTGSTYSGDTTINAGAINAGSNNALGTGNVTVASGAALQLSTSGTSLGSGNATVTLNGVGTGGTNSGALINVNGGSTRLNNNVTLASNTTISSGNTSGATLIVGGAPPSYTPGVSASNTNALALGANKLTFVGAAGTTTQVDAGIAGTGGVDINTSGTVHYNANQNTYTGTTSVLNGTLIVDTANNNFAPHSSYTSFFGVNGPLVIGDGSGSALSAVVQLGATGSPGVTNDALNSTSPLTIYSDGYLNLNNNAQNVGKLTMIGGKIDTGANGTLYLDYANTSVDINPTSTSGTATINGTLSLTYYKDATTEGSNPNQSRIFNVGHDSSNTSDLTINAVIANGSLIKNGTGTLTLATSNNTYSGSTTVNNGILNVQVGTENVSGAHRSSLGAGDGNNSSGAGTTVNSGGTLQIQGGIAITNEQLTLNGNGYDSGSGAIGALNNLSGNNVWGGNSTTGTIALGSDARMTSTAGLLTINTTISSASGTGYALTVDGAGNTTINGSINTGSTGTVTKTGTGTLILAGNNGYQGATNITAGVVSAQNNGALGLVTTGTAGTFVTSGAELQLSNAANGNLTIGGEALSLNGSGVGGSSGALHNVAGDNSFGGLVTLASASTIKSDVNTLTLSGGTTSANNGLTIAGAGNVTISGNMTNGTGSLTKNDAGTFTFSGTSGTVGQAHLLAGNMAVGGSSTLHTAEFNSSVGTTLTIATGGTVYANYGTGTTTYFSGAMAGGGTFEKDGAGTLVFDHSFTASNLTLTLNGGTLQLTGAQITVGTIHITGNTILDFSNSAGTFLSSAALVIDAGVTVTVNNWISTANNTGASTIWYATNTVNGGTLGTTNQYGGTPLGQITFTNYNGMTTTWVAPGSSAGWFDHEIRPTPEPATYGFIFLGGALGLVGWRRWRAYRKA